MIKNLVKLFVFSSIFLSIGAHAGTIYGAGGITPISTIDQFSRIDGQIDFSWGNNQGHTFEWDYYAEQGVMFHSGAYVDMLEGVTSVGRVNDEVSATRLDQPSVISGGGWIDGLVLDMQSAITLTTPTKAFGLTAVDQSAIITAWGTDGKLLGQVAWVPDVQDEGGFVGITTDGTDLIAMIAVSGGYSPLTAKDANGFYLPPNPRGVPITDNWVWGEAAGVPEPSSFALFGLSALGFASLRKKRKV